MQNFQSLWFMFKQSFICCYITCMTVPLKISSHHRQLLYQWLVIWKNYRVTQLKDMGK